MNGGELNRKTGPATHAVPGQAADQQAAGPARAPWRPLDVLVIVILAITGNIGVFILAGLVLALLEALGLPVGFEWLTGSIAGVTVQLLLQWGVTLGVAWLFLRGRGYRLSPGQMGFRSWRLGRGILYLLGVLIAYYFVISPLYMLMLELFGISFDPAQDLTEAYNPAQAGLGVALAVALVQVAMIVPVVEELFFRGIIYQGLESRWGYLPAAIASASVFTLAHVDPVIFFPIFALGFGFATLFYLTRSLWPSIIGHVIVNIIGVMAQFASYLTSPENGG